MPRPYRAEMGVPPMPDEGAPGPLTRAQRMEPMNIGPRLSPEERRRFSNMMPMEPVSPGEEVGMKEAREESKVYKKKMAAGGSASSRADGCAQRGKTKGKML